MRLVLTSLPGMSATVFDVLRRFDRHRRPSHMIAAIPIVAGLVAPVPPSGRVGLVF
jgi:hypothetical protein